MAAIRSKYLLILSSLIVFGVSITWSLFFYAASIEQGKMEDLFDYEVQEISHTIETHISNSLNMIQGVKALYLSSEFVDRDEFNKYSSYGLRRLDGIQALEWIPRVPHSERSNFENKARSDGYPDFQFTERGNDEQIIRAKDRNEYFPIFYIEPYNFNEEELGFDLSSNKVRKNTLLKAMNTGELTATDKITLTQDNKKHSVLLVFNPVYITKHTPSTQEERKKHLQGYILGVFHVENLVEAALAKLRIEGIYFRVSSIKPSINKETIYESYNTGYKKFERYNYINVADLEWELYFSPTEEFLAVHNNPLKWIILLCGFLLTILLASFAFMRLSHLTTMEREEEERTKKLHLSEEKTRTILNTVIDGIVTIDEKGIVASFNPAAEEMFGYKAEEIIGKNVSILMSKEYRLKHDNYINNYLKTGIEKVIGIGQEVTAQRKDGSVFPIKLGINSFINQNKTIFVGTLHDISEQINNEKRLKEYARNLTLTKQEAEKANLTKSAFLANMSHELRTPLNGIIGMCDILMTSKLDKDQRENAEAVQSSSKSLLNILNDILDISKIEAGEINIEELPFDIDIFAKKMVQLFKPLTNKKKIKLLIKRADDIPPVIIGDLCKFEQILRNLLINAIKFTEEGTITVCIETQKKNRKDYIYLAIKDTGCGIPKDKIDSIFKKFTQVDTSVTRKFGGTGLGLAICKQLVEMMGGEIGVDSIEYKGSTFWCLLPLIVADEDAKPINLHNENHIDLNIDIPENIHILSVDDYPTNQLFVKKLLKRLGFNNVDLAENGKDALAKIKKNKYDIVLMDCQMPILDGYQATKILREMERETEEHLPVIALTAYAMIGDKEKCINAGMDDYLSKPMSPEKLISLLKKYAGQKNKESLMNEAINNNETPTAAKSISKVEDSVDLTHLEIFTGGDAAEEKELLDLFFEQANISLESLEKACANEDNKNWKKAAHSIKGASRNLGANALAVACEIAEDSFKNSKTEKEKLLMNIKEKLADVKYFLETR